MLGLGALNISLFQLDTNATKLYHQNVSVSLALKLEGSLFVLDHRSWETRRVTVGPAFWRSWRAAE